MPPPAAPSPPRRVCLLGSTGTIGRAALDELRARNLPVLCLRRSGPDAEGEGVIRRRVDVADAGAVAEAMAASGCDAVISCMASRSGVPADAWAIDHRAHLAVLAAAHAAGVSRFVLLSALCVQKPVLAFQHAKLAFEAALSESGLRFAIVRPTAFFKSLSGQVERVRRGRPFLLFGDGRLTATKPIGDRDLAAFLADCLGDPARWGCVLPVGGPGPAFTPREQGEALFALLGRAPRFRSVPVRLLDGIVAGLSLAARAAPPRFAASLATKAELARIGRYYATEPMLVRDPATGRPDADGTPSFGTETLFDHYRALLAGAAAPERGAHTVF